MPTLTPAQTDSLLAVRSADTLAGHDVIGAKAVASVAASILADDGHREYIDQGASRIYRKTSGSPLRVAWRALVALVGDLVGEILDALLLVAPAASSGAKRAAALRMVLRRRERGATVYLRVVASAVRDRLPALSEEDYEDAENAVAEQVRAARKAARPASTAEELLVRRSATSAKRQASREEDLAATADLLGKWAAGLPAGRYLIGDVWASWSHAVQSNEKLRAADHRARRIGRSRFYELLARDFTVVNGGARSRYLVVA